MSEKVRFSIRRLPEKEINQWCVVDQKNGNRKVYGEQFYTSEAAQRFADQMNELTTTAKVKP